MAASVSNPVADRVAASVSNQLTERESAPWGKLATAATAETLVAVVATEAVVGPGEGDMVVSVVMIVILVRRHCAPEQRLRAPSHKLPFLPQGQINGGTTL